MLRRLSLMLTMLAAMSLVASPVSVSAAPAQSTKISFSVVNRPLAAVLAGLSYEFHTNIIADQSLGALPVTLTMKNVTLDQALAAIAKAYDLQTRNVDGVIVVGKSGGVYGSQETLPLRFATASVVAKNLQQGAFASSLVVIGDDRTNSVVLIGQPDTIAIATSIVRALDVPGTGTVSSITYKLAHISPEIAVARLQGAIPASNGVLTAVPATQADAVVLTGAPGAIDLAEQILSQLDAAPKRVAIAVRVLDVTPTDDQKDLGVILGGYSPSQGSISGSQPAANQLFEPFVNRTLQVNATINTLIQHGTAKVLSSPNTLVESGESGKIQVGSELPIVTNNGGLVGGVTVTNLNTGVELDVTPIVGADGTIDIRLTIKYSQIIGTSQGFPILAVREVDTHVPVRAGETITFGGLTEDDHSRTETKVPVLGDIPFFGKLFRNVQSQDVHEEIVFQITPNIVN